MRVGLMTYEWQDMVSLHYLSRLTDVCLRERHEVSYCPPQYLHVSRAERFAMVKDWVAACDVLAVPIDPIVFQARSELTTPGPPAIVFAMGVPARGGRAIEAAQPHLRMTDLLVGSCTAEVEQCRAFLPDAAVRLLPFPVDDRNFYPEAPAAVAAARRALGIDPHARVVLYAGRISLDKNLHTALRAFSVVRRAVPDSVFVVAGAETNWAFGEFGVFAVEVTRMLRKQIRALGIEPGAVRFIGPRAVDELRALYTLADLTLNLTLNHNENFGVAQVEAMLCGTPVVGTGWGGLRDTIVEGVTGRTVAPVLTRSGVKVNWWEAAQAALQELRFRGDRDARRRACRSTALARYSLERYRDSLEAVLAECRARGGCAGGPLLPSGFARRLWALFHNGDGTPPYRRGPEASELYRELVRPLLGSPDRAGATPASLQSALVCLASPVARRSTGALAIEDPIYPMDVEVPGDLAESVDSLLRVLQRQPVVAADVLTLGCADRAQAERALLWMADVGIALLGAPGHDDVEIQPPVRPLEEPVFNIVPVDHQVDVFYLR